ncbi:MAG: hypothetical protein ABIO70_31700 [Pseudomonadota bacterium]
MSNPDILRYLVPREWSAEQALLAVELLGQARSAIWAVHGESMAAALSDDQDRFDRLEDFIGDDDEVGMSDEEIPF